MLPPDPVSRQASYTLSLPRRVSSRAPSFGRRQSSQMVRDTQLEEEEDDELAEELNGMDDTLMEMDGRGLEETLEKLGFGASDCDAAGPDE